MGQRNPCCRRRTQGGSHARDNLKRNAGSSQRLDFFSCSAEDQGIATLQPDHIHSGIGERNHQKVDLFLNNIFLAGALAHVMHLRLGGNEPQDLGSYQVIVQYRVGGSQQTKRPQREQLRVARPRAHQINFPLHTSSPFAASSTFSDAVSANAASSASLLANECNSSSLHSLSRSLARMSFRVSPSSATQSAYPGPNCFSSCCRIFCARDGLCPEVETAIC